MAPKAIDPDMLTHLQGEATTLTTCWSIKRRDGKEFLFTDLDHDLVFGGKTYRADLGYSKTAISSTLALDTDNLDLEGFFSSGAIAEADVKNGLFDYAEVSFFLVNYRAPDTHGSIMLRRGYIGEVTSQSTGRFNIELRGMLQKLNHKPGEVYSPGCRAELGDKRCKIPIFPPIRQQNCRYLAGEFIQVIDPAQSVIKKQNVLDRGFESPGIPDWVVINGGVTSLAPNKAHSPGFRGDRTARTPFLSVTSSMAISQDVPISLTSGLTLADIDAGNVYAYASAMAITGGQVQRDQARFRLVALNDSGLEIGEIFNSKFAVMKPLRVWKRLHCRASKIPTGTRTIRVFLEGRTVTGSTCEVAFDDVNLSIVKPTTTVTKAFKNDIHECTVSGVTDVDEITYPVSNGTVSVDGSAEFTTRQSFAVYASVDTVVNPKNKFTISTSLPNDWFSGGTVTFDTGANEGYSMEIKDHGSGGSITLSFNLPFDIAVNDKMTMIPGCNKTTDHCINKFRIFGTRNFATGNIANFRGEPDLPGEEINLYPNAKR
jgi:hypothetical protein